MALIPVSDTLNTTIEVRTTVIRQDTMLRIWQGRDTTLADLRLTPSEARALAAQLLHEAGQQDGHRVSFHWHDGTCTPHDIANGTCVCVGTARSVGV
jgi:hypothetical protein